MEDNKTMEEDLFINDFIHRLEIPVQNAKNPNVIKKYNFGLKEIGGFESDLLSKHAIKLNARTGQTEIHQEEANIKFLQACLVEAPFAVTEENIRRLSKKIRDKLIDFARKINEVGDDVEKKSEGLLEGATKDTK